MVIFLNRMSVLGWHFQLFCEILSHRASSRWFEWCWFVLNAAARCVTEFRSRVRFARLGEVAGWPLWACRWRFCRRCQWATDSITRVGSTIILCLCLSLHHCALLVFLHAHYILFRSFRSTLQQIWPNKANLKCPSVRIYVHTSVRPQKVSLFSTKFGV